MLGLFLCFAYIGVCWIYPLVRTFDQLGKDETKPLWISYWLIYGVLSFLENTLISFLTPLSIYKFFKTLFALWLIHSDYKGAEFIHEQYFGQLYAQANAVLKNTPLKTLVQDQEESEIS